MTTQTETVTPRTGTALIRHLLEQDERSISWLARQMGVSAPHMYRVITGERPITASMAQRLADLFGVDASVFRGPDK